MNTLGGVEVGVGLGGARTLADTDEGNPPSKLHRPPAVSLQTGSPAATASASSVDAKRVKSTGDSFPSPDKLPPHEDEAAEPAGHFVAGPSRVCSRRLPQGKHEKHSCRILYMRPGRSRHKDFNFFTSGVWAQTSLFHLHLHLHLPLHLHLILAARRG